MPKDTEKKDAAPAGKLTKAEIATLTTAIYEGLCRAGFGYESILTFGKAIYAGLPVSKLDIGSIGHIVKVVHYLDTQGALDFLRTAAPPAAKVTVESKTDATIKSGGAGGNGSVSAKVKDDASATAVTPDKVIPPEPKKKAEGDKGDKNKDGAAQKTD